MTADLYRLIANARADLASELHFAPSSSRPVLDRVQEPYFDKAGRRHMEWVDDPEGSDVSRIGATISKRLQRKLQRNYGLEMTTQRALQRLEPYCARRHLKAGEPLHFERGYICPRITRFVLTTGYGEQGIEESWEPHLRNNYYARLIRRAAYDEELEFEEAAEFLAGALQAMQRWCDEWQAGAA